MIIVNLFLYCSRAWGVQDLCASKAGVTEASSPGLRVISIFSVCARVIFSLCTCLEREGVSCLMSLLFFLELGIEPRGALLLSYIPGPFYILRQGLLLCWNYRWN